MDDKSAWTEWADVLGSAGGGFLAAMGVWLLGAEDCPISGTTLTTQCVPVGAVQYGMEEIAFGVPLIAAAIGLFIHAVRS